MKLLYDESSYYCGGDDAGTYKCKVGAKKDGTITAVHWHMLGIRNPAIEKTHVSTKIPNILGTQEWALINKGHACVSGTARIRASRTTSCLTVLLRNWDWIRQKSR